ncbi:MAG: hypothetical protein AAB582_00445, partial [Patescibacteria group bacterium]
METNAMYQAHVKELERLGALYVTYDPALRKIVAEAMKNWDAFCELPDEQKVLFSYTPDHKVSGNGYELKREGGIDFKENCHLRMDARDELLRGSALAHPTLGPAFVESALAVNERMTEVARDFSRLVEQEYGLEGFEDDVMRMQSRWLFRFLHYFPVQTEGQEIAAPHVDKGGFTLHLYESDPGVEYYDYKTRAWEELPLAHDQTVMFPGMLFQHQSRCRLRELAHLFMATKNT